MRHASRKLFGRLRRFAFHSPPISQSPNLPISIFISSTRRRGYLLFAARASISAILNRTLTIEQPPSSLR